MCVSLCMPCMCVSVCMPCEHVGGTEQLPGVAFPSARWAPGAWADVVWLGPLTCLPSLAFLGTLAFSAVS